jgi:PEP-CTERM motif
MRPRFTPLRLATFLILGCPAAAQACPALPATYAFEEAFGGIPDEEQTNTGAGSVSSPTSSANATFGADPTISANASGVVTGGNAREEYYLEACGTGTTATLLMSGSVKFSTSVYATYADAFGTGSLEVGVPDGGVLSPEFAYLYVYNYLSETDGATSTTHYQTPETALPATALVVPANTLIEVELSVEASANSGTASASVDPTFELDPLAPSSVDFTLEFSQGVTSSAPISAGSAIPEPSTWMMSLLGLAGLGLASRRGLRNPIAA